MSDLMVRGPLWGSTGSPSPFTSAFSGAQRSANAHGPLTQATLENRLFSIGTATAALSANTISLTNTTTPILGVWNPPSSTVNLLIISATLQVFINTLTTPVGSGALVWAGSVGNIALTLGTNPYSRRTMTSTGSTAKGFTPAVALTGITNNLVIFAGSGLINTTPVTHGTVTAVTAQLSGGGTEFLDGSLCVPPGGLLCLLNTTSTTTCSVAGNLLWEEVPIFT